MRLVTPTYTHLNNLAAGIRPVIANGCHSLAAGLRRPFAGIRSASSARGDDRGVAFTAAAPAAGSTRHRVTLAVAGVSFVLVASLTTALPSYAAHADPASTEHVAATPHASPAVVQQQNLRRAIVTAAARGDVQKLAVPADVAQSSVDLASYSSVDRVATLQSTYGVDHSMALQLMGTANPNARAAIVTTAMSYLGTPYVLGGASHSGIDCSGLTMVAYAAAGVGLVHYVPSQDAVGQQVSDPQPGDLVVWDDEEHVGIYMGNGTVLHAPTEGRDVELDPLTDWAGIPYHFTRLI